MLKKNPDSHFKHQAEKQPLKSKTNTSESQSVTFSSEHFIHD